jgi:hypothetical protein
MQQFGNGRPGRADRRRGQVGYAKCRDQLARAAEAARLEERRRPTRRQPERPQMTQRPILIGRGSFSRHLIDMHVRLA